MKVSNVLKRGKPRLGCAPDLLAPRAAAPAAGSVPREAAGSCEFPEFLLERGQAETRRCRSLSFPSAGLIKKGVELIAQVHPA